jgi:hypothetical protein
MQVTARALDERRNRTRKKEGKEGTQKERREEKGM